jgi:hypothetical protein
MLLLGAWTGAADTYRLYEDAPDGPTGTPGEWAFELLDAAWTHATVTNPGDHTILLEWKGPVSGGSPNFTVPALVLGNSGHITITTLAGVRPEIRPDGDHPAFRNMSTSGKSLTLRGFSTSVFERITLWSAYASPLLDCGDTGAGDGTVILENVNVFKAERSPGPPEVPGAPDGPYLRINNRAAGAHLLKYVQFMGGDNQVQSQPLLSTGPLQSDATLYLRLENVNFQPAKGSGVRLYVRNVAQIAAVSCVFAPEGGEFSTTASAVDAGTLSAPDGGTVAVFVDCQFRSGDNNLFSRLGDSANVTPNRFLLYRPVFTGKCGERAFNIGNSGARVEILGLDPGADLFDPADDTPILGYRVDMDGLTADTGVYARILKGSMKFDHVQGTIKPYVNNGVVSLGAVLEGPVSVEMYSCDWANGAGTYRCGATGGAFAPQITAVNTVFRGGGVSSYFDTSGFSETQRNTGQAVIDLRHVTLTSPEASPMYSMLLKGQPGDLLYSGATIYDAPVASNLTPQLAIGAEWTNLAWNRETPNGLGGFATPPSTGVIYADPKLNPGSGKLETGSGALGRATSAGSPDNTPVDFEGDPRPMPAGLGVPDIGADEADFAPTGIIIVPNPPQISDSASTGDLVAALLAVDPDPGDTAAFLLLDNAGGRFKLSGNDVVVDNGALLDARLNAAHSILVRVTDSTGKSFQKSFVVNVLDTTGPYLSDVQVSGALEVLVTFSEPMQAPGVTNPLNYQLSGSGQGTLADFPDAVSAAGGNTYRLTWSAGEMYNLGDITITVSGVADTWGNPIGLPNSLTDVGGAGGGLAPILSSIIVQGPRIIQVVFSERMQESGPGGVLDPANYHWWVTSAPGIVPETVTPIPETTNMYWIAWTAGDAITEGQTATVRVENVADLAGNPIDPARQEATYTYQGSAPRVMSAVATSDHSITVRFNEPMGSGVTTAANYTLSDPPGAQGKGTLAARPSSVVHIPESTWYSLTWNTGEMHGGSLVRIRAQNVQDLVGNLIDPTFNAATCISIGTPPTVSQVAVLDLRTVRVSFSEAMLAGLTSPTRYTLSGPGQGTLNDYPYVVTELNNQTYLLEWDTGALTTGDNVTITVTTAQDLAGNTLGSPNSGTVTDRIKITQSPVAAQRYENAPYQLSVIASGGLGGLHYQWRKDGLPAGGDAPTMDFPALAVADSGSYVCVVSDSREETVESAAATIAVYPHLHFVQQPQGDEVLEGAPFQLSVEVTGGVAPITYLWKRNGENVGVDAPFYNITAMKLEHEGTYTVDVSDANETFTSNPAEVTFVVGVPVLGLGGLAALAALVALAGTRTARRRR